jgi:Domain of unknown function (DUF1918)
VSWIRDRQLAKEVPMNAKVGDWLVVERVHLGEPRRRGQIVELHHQDGTPPYLVRWTDTNETTLVFPGPDARVEPAEHNTAPAPVEGDGRHN